MDWFEKLTGFQERDYRTTQSSFEIDGNRLRSKFNHESFATGTLEIPSLAELRKRASDVLTALRGRLKVSCSAARDVADLHCDRANEHALFQVASQFNLLEMPHYDVTPEDGITGYSNDNTQGPACAMAAGAATIYRNYFVDVERQRGQTRQRQIDCLADLGSALGNEGNRLWEMRNGYAMCTAGGLDVINERLKRATEAERDELRSLHRIGLHRDVEVTASPKPYPLVSQAFCSALPVGYWESIRIRRAEPLATLVLEAAYEATLWGAVLNASRSSSRTVFLTRVGGGVFKNDEHWIDSAMRRALDIVKDLALDVRLVSRGEPPDEFLRLRRDYG